MRLILISGASGSGKSYTAKLISDNIKNTIVLSTDDYYRNIVPKFVLGKTYISYYDRLISIKYNKLVKNIKKLLKGDPYINSCKYNFINKNSTKEKIKNLEDQSNGYLIVEGIFSFRLPKDIYDLANLRILCTNSKAKCYQRRTKRDIEIRSRDNQEIGKRFNRGWDLYHKNLRRNISRNEYLEIVNDNLDEIILKLKS